MLNVKAFKMALNKTVMSITLTISLISKANKSLNKDK